MMEMIMGSLLHYALVFLVVALIAAAVGFGGVAGFAMEAAQLLFWVFRLARRGSRETCLSVGKRCLVMGKKEATMKVALLSVFAAAVLIAPTVGTSQTAKPQADSSFITVQPAG